jgi:tetratricopeptide (TPR) repeat protein
MIKKQIVYSIQITFLLLIMNLPLVFADTVILKSGKRIEGEIIEKTDEYIKLDTNGLNLTFWPDEIERIEAEKPTLPKDNMLKEPSNSSEYRKMVSEFEKCFLNRKYEDAILVLKKEIELNPNNNNYELYFALGMTYYYLNNFQDSISSLQKAITLNPSGFEYYLCLNIVYESAGLQNEAKEALIKARREAREKNSLEAIIFTDALIKKIIK